MDVRHTRIRDQQDSLRNASRARWPLGKKVGIFDKGESNRAPVYAKASGM